MDNYTLSNQLDLPPVRKEHLPKAMSLYKQCRESTTITQDQLQTLSDSILALFDLASITVVFDGVQPHSNNAKGSIKRKTMGLYKSVPMLSNGKTIRIYKYTAKRHQIYAPKSAVSTLVHEIVHHLDTVLLSIRSIHSAGFYIRISKLESLLK